MRQLTQEDFLVEDLRRRAKDNKAKLGHEFAVLSEKYLESTRNYAFLISLGFIGYIGGVKQDLTDWDISFVVISLLSGIVSIYNSYRYAYKNANYYSDLEENLSTAFLTATEYEQVIGSEVSIKKRHEKRHVNQAIAVWSLWIQLSFLTIFMVSILTQ